MIKKEVTNKQKRKAISMIEKQIEMSVRKMKLFVKCITPVNNQLITKHINLVWNTDGTGREKTQKKNYVEMEQSVVR